MCYSSHFQVSLFVTVFINPKISLKLNFYKLDLLLIIISIDSDLVEQVNSRKRNF